jgi:maltooligosyltrehalose trehalohydrolase
VVGDQTFPLDAESNGYFSLRTAAIRSGASYKLKVDDQPPFPDPASRWQPEGVHGPSAVVDPSLFRWTDHAWQGVAKKSLVIYELHVGTFTQEGTFRAAVSKLDELHDLGVTAIEIMPVADFPGNHNWGYDGVCLFAPARCYGTPDDLRFLINEAHRKGLGVLMDVVYNHLGPDGNYTGAFSPYYFTDRHKSPWGAGVNLDGEYNAEVRAFFLQNALHWIYEYHLDGLRLDATHAIVDDSKPHFVAELAERVHTAHNRWPLHVIAEDHRNLADMIQPKEQNGWNLDGVWADDFHHEARRMLAGDHESYYQDYAGTTENLAKSVQQGWLFTGQPSAHMGHPRGTPVGDLSYDRFVIFIQNHDQVGNRARGERLHHQIDLAAYRALTALWLACPETPMLFMGQEWAASTPFQFFTDHAPELGKLITEGRRHEFQTFSAFRDSEMQKTIPDPQAETTFIDSKIHWEERHQMPHAGVAALYRALLHLRQRESALTNPTRAMLRTAALDSDTVAIARTGPLPFVVIARLRGQGPAALPSTWNDLIEEHLWHAVLTTEDTAFAGLGVTPEIHLEPGRIGVTFHGPAAVILKGHTHG